MAHKVTIDVEARFIDNVSTGAQKATKSIDAVEKAADDARKSVDELGKKKAQVKVDGDDSRISRILRTIESKLAKLGRSRAEVKLGAQDKASSVISKILGMGKSLAGRTFSAIAKIKDSNALKTLSEITAAGKNIAGKTWTAIVKIKDLATAPLRKIRDSIFNIKNLIGGIIAGAAVNQAVQTGIAQPVGLADSIESSRIAFESKLGSASAANDFLQQIYKFDEKSPFDTLEIVGIAQQMMNLGWTAENVLDDLGTIGDWSASLGKGEEGISAVTRALGQMRMKGKLSSEEMLQLTEAGVDAWNYVADYMGKDIATVREMAEDGAISVDDAIRGIMEGMSAYSGSAAALSDRTVNGIIDQIKSLFKTYIALPWGEGLSEGLKSGLGAIRDYIDENKESLKKLGEAAKEVGQAISNWAADKLESAMKTIARITNSEDFKEGSIGKKISMLWNGLVVDPLKEWWENGGRDKTAETAGKIGSWMGEMLTKGLLALFGATDVLKDIDGTDVGGNIAGSFVQGFLQNFDGQAITDAFVQAINNVWNALPTWAKFLVGGYVGGKAIGGISNLISGIGNIASTAGKFIGSASAGTGLAGFGANTAIGLGAGNLAGGASMSAAGLSAVGLSATAGGIAAVASTIKGGLDLYKSYNAYKKGDTTNAKAYGASGGTTLGGVGVGAAAGAAIGSIIPGIGTAVGALVGAGIGGVSGWIGGNKWAESIRKNAEAAKYETEEMKAVINKADASAEEFATTLANARMTNLIEHFGDVKLSLGEIQTLAEQIVWGDDKAHYENFTRAIKDAKENLESFHDAAEKTGKWMWKAGLGVKFDETEIESIKESFDEYISSAQSYMENKHYEFTTAVSLLVDVESDEGKSIIASGNAFYGAKKSQLESLGSRLSKEVEIALEDGVITLNEQAEIANTQKQIANIMNKVATAEQQAEIELARVKFGGGNLDLESFDTFMSQMQTTLDERMTAYDEAFVASVANLNLELDNDAINKEQYYQQLQTLVDGLTTKVDGLKAEIMDVELEIIGDAYSEELGEDAKAKLQSALEKSLSEGIDPISWTADQAKEYLGVDQLSEEAAGAIGQMLSGVASQLELLEVDGTIKAVWNLGESEDPTEKIKESVPDAVEETVGVNISGEKNVQTTIEILKEDFGIPDEYAATLALLIAGDKQILSKIDTSKLAEEFGIPESIAKNIIAELSATKTIEERINIVAGDFGIPDSITKQIKINLEGVKGKITSAIGNIKSAFGLKEYRGGIVGGTSSSMQAFARGGIAGYSDGGMVRGGAQLITVAEEGNPEMIIPLSSQRRGRALKLWAQAGHMMKVPGFARGGITDGSQDEGFRFNGFGSNESSGGQTVHVDIGGVTFELHVNANDGTNIVEAIKEQAGEIAEVLAGTIADALGGQFENTPVRGGA